MAAPRTRRAARAVATAGQTPHELFGAYLESVGVSDDRLLRSSPSCSTRRPLMRPISLTAEGFTAFRDAVDVDFTGADFFALVGPTGSGKSSVLDAICFALYGIVPRYDDDRLVAPSITQGAQRGKGVVAVRARRIRVRRDADRAATKNGGATTKEARLECDGEVLAGDAKGMNEAVTAAHRPAVPALHPLRDPPAGRIRAVPARQAVRPARPPRQAARPRHLRAHAPARPQLADEKQNEVALDVRHDRAVRRLHARGARRRDGRAQSGRRASQAAGRRGTGERRAAGCGRGRGRSGRSAWAASCRSSRRCKCRSRCGRCKRNEMAAVAAQRAAAEAEEAAGGALTEADAAASALPEPAEIKAALDAHGDLADILPQLEQNDAKVAALSPELSDAAERVGRGGAGRGRSTRLPSHDHVPNELDRGVGRRRTVSRLRTGGHEEAEGPRRRGGPGQESARGCPQGRGACTRSGGEGGERDCCGERTSVRRSRGSALRSTSG